MMENYDTQNNKHCQHLGAFCPHVKEHGVQCDTESSCTNCGWNPRVAAERKAKIRAARAKPKGKKIVHFYLGSGAFEGVLPKSTANVMECHTEKC